MVISFLEETQPKRIAIHKVMFRSQQFATDFLEMLNKFGNLSHVGENVYMFFPEDQNISSILNYS